MLKRTIATVFVAALLCLVALPATAMAATAYDTLRIGNTLITGSGYWTTDGNGNLTASDAGNYNVAFDADTNTLSLNNATIVGSYDANNNPGGTGIYAGSRFRAVSLTIQVTGNNVVSGSYGIYALSNGGEVSVTISGGGSLTASGSQAGIRIISEFSNAALAIEGTAVKASGSYSEGVMVQAGDSSTGSLSVDGGSLTASGNTGIEFWFSTGMSGSGTPSLTVAGNAVVDAKGGGIAHNSSNNLSIQGNSGIVFNGSTGIVYGNASLQDDLIIGEGERLILDNGANLDANGHNVIVDGGTVDDSIKNGLGDRVKYTPSITTASLSNGTVGASYGQALAATGSDTITWSVASGSLPTGLSLDGSTGAITGTPTTEGTSTFTVKAANSYGSDSKEYTLTIDPKQTVSVIGVTLSATSLTLTEKETATLTATVQPTNATNQKVTWSSSDSKVATVDTNGKVTAVDAGTAIITVTTEDGSKTATCTVTVEHDPAGAWSSDADGHWHACAVCGDELDYAVHTSKVEGEQGATCTEDGYTGDTVCSVCRYAIAKGKAIPATGHDFVDGDCTVCSAEEPTKDEGTIPATGDVAPLVCVLSGISGIMLVDAGLRKRASR